MSASNDTLIGADWLLNAYQVCDVEQLKLYHIALHKPSLLVDVRNQHPQICEVADEAIFNPTHHADYEPQCHDNLYHQLRYLQLEFIGQSELAFYHSLLIVLLRRGYQPCQTFAVFEALWQQQSGYFFEQLSLRWLTSAADTFIDFSPSPVRRAILMNVVSLVNTLKIYETELFLLTDNHEPQSSRVDALSAKHHGLYDGLTLFRLGSDDTLAQMRGRYERFAKQDAFATRFLLMIFARLHETPSAFNLLKQFHKPEWAYWQIP